MWNKKATDIAPGEWTGIITSIVVITLFSVVFVGCTAFFSTQSHKLFIASKVEIEAIKELNNFLELPIDQEKSVLDLIIESFNDDEYSELHNLAKEHFSKKYDNWGLVVKGFRGTTLYNSISYGGDLLNMRLIPVIAYSEIKLPILEKENEITVVFQIREE